MALKRFFIRVAVVFLLIHPLFCHSITNLIQNSGFEQVNSTNRQAPLKGWWISKTTDQLEVKLDDGIAHSGDRSVRLEGKPGSRYVLASNKFAVNEFDDIQFGAWLRTESARSSGRSAYVALVFRSKEGKILDRINAYPETISSVWSQVSSNAIVPVDARFAELHLGYNDANAPVWFDDAVASIDPLSITLIKPPRPWLGRQHLVLRFVNAGTNVFLGKLQTTVASKSDEISVRAEPGTTNTVYVPVRIPKAGLHNYEITLLDDKAKAQRTTTGKFRTFPPLKLYPPVPCYHPVGRGPGEVHLTAGIVVNPLETKDFQLSVALLDSAKKQVSATTTNIQGDLARVSLPLPIEKPADFQIVARLYDLAHGDQIAYEKIDVHVKGIEDSIVSVGPDGFLRIGGKPHFPIGMYNAARYEEISAAGFSVTHNYGIVGGEPEGGINSTDGYLKTLLDESWENGLGMMVELPREAIEKRDWEQVRRRVETFKNHPGLLCWGSEERVARGMAPLKNIQELYRILHQSDPNHPLVLGDSRDLVGCITDRSYFFPESAMDVGIWWWYPIPIKSPGKTPPGHKEKAAKILEPPSWLTTTRCKKPLWIAIQSYQRPQRDARFPTPKEYRCMAYLSIINGAKGIFFYIGVGERDHEGNLAGLLNNPQESHWDYVKKLVREIRDLSPVIMQPPSRQDIILSPTNAPIEFSLRQTEEGLYMFAANKSDKTQSVRFSGKTLLGKQVRVLFEKHEAINSGSSLADVFDPFGVHVYLLK